MLFHNLSNNRSEQNSRHNCAVFGDFVLDFDRGSLQKDGADVPLRPKSFKVLTYLVTHHGILVSKEELLDAVWPKTVVTEDSLIQCLIEIRKALGDHNKDMIVTLPRRGYLFDLTVTLAQVSGHTVNTRRPVIISLRRPSVWSAGGVLLVAILAVSVWWDLHNKVSDSNQLVSSGLPAVTNSATNSAAGQHYLQGRFFQNRRAQSDLDLAILEYRKALEIDPEMAVAWLGLGAAYYLKNWESDSANSDEHVKYLKRALELEPNNAEANMRMSNYYYWLNNPEKDAEHLEIALKYGQKDPVVLSMAAGSLMYQLRIDDAVALQRRSVELDPTSITLHYNLAGFYFFAGRVEEAIAEYNMVLELSPKNKSHVALSMLQIALSQNELQQADRWAEFVIDDRPSALMAKAMLASASGRQAEAEESIALLVSDPDPQAAFKLAEYYSYNNDPQTALKWLNETLVRLQVDPSIHLACQLRADAHYSPFLSSLQTEPQWSDWKQEMSLLSPAQSNFNIAAWIQSY